jgi:hypothetical protein
MEIKLTRDEVKEILFSALCNGGIQLLRGAGVELGYSIRDYHHAKDTLLKQKPSEQISYEDVLIQILEEGKELRLVDEEGSGEYTRRFNLEQAITNLSKKEAAKDVIETLNEEDDACTAYSILQYVAYNEVIFG